MGKWGLFAKEFFKVAAKDVLTGGLLSDPSPPGMPGCPQCGGKGFYGGMRALPGDPGSGSKPIPCGCVYRRIRDEHNARLEPEEPFVSYRDKYQADVADPMSPQEWEHKRRRGQQTGEFSLCCGLQICECGQNLRMIEGRPQRLPGVVMPGTSAAQIHEGVEAAKRQLEAGTNKTYSLRDWTRPTDNAAETTMPLPSIDDIPRWS